MVILNFLPARLSGGVLGFARQNYLTEIY